MAVLYLYPILPFPQIMGACYMILNFSYGQLVQHNFIPDNEIHLKIGGDHGGGSFKMCYQIANTENPNSKDNTLVFCLFEAKDTKANLKTALGRFKEQINNIQLSKWK